MINMEQGRRWIIFYTDGSIFSSVDGSAWDAPRRSVQSIASNKQSKEQDWYNINQRDYYYFEEEHGGWNEATDLFTVYDHLLRTKFPCVLFGRMLSDVQWRDTHTNIIRFCEEHRAWLIGKDSVRPPKKFM